MKYLVLILTALYMSYVIYGIYNPTEVHPFLFQLCIIGSIGFGLFSVMFLLGDDYE